MLLTTPLRVNKRLHTKEPTASTSTRRIDIPSSLKPPRHSKKKKKMTQKDVANIMSLNKNSAVLHQLRERRKQELRRKQRIVHANAVCEDFMTMMLIKWSLVELAAVTDLLLDVASVQDDNDHEEYAFSTRTRIRMPECGDPCFIDYYRLVYQSAMDKIATTQINNAAAVPVPDTQDEYRQAHIMRLLRACFVIGFLYDTRIRRFVMAQHTIHTLYMRTRPPDPARICSYMREIEPCVNTFLAEDRYDILSMVDQCSTVWLSRYMI